MGLVQSPGPFAGGSRAGAERLMAALESCQLSLMNVDFCCWPLKSVLLWSRTMQKPETHPDCFMITVFGTFLKRTLCQFGKGLFQEMVLVSVAF